MRILLLNDYATPNGGAEVTLVTLRDGLQARGHEVRVFASTAHGKGFADYHCFGTTGPFRTLLQTANPFAFRRLRQVLREFQPDVVHVRLFLTQLSPLILPLLRDVPSLYDVPWYKSICPLGTKFLPNRTVCRVRAGLVCWKQGCVPLHDWLPLMLQMKLFRRWSKVFRLVVAHSENLKRTLTAEGIGPMELVSYGVPVRPMQAPLSPVPTVAFAGRLVPEKGADVLLKAFSKALREVPHARLLLAGDGRELPFVRKWVHGLGISQSVSLLGALPYEELERVLEGAWVQAVPSLWQEPFGMVAVDAMMRGSVVVASRSGGLVEIVEEGKTGFLVPPGDEEALAAALVRLLRDRKLSETMGEAGRQRAIAQFNAGRYVEEFLRLYERIC